MDKSRKPKDFLNQPQYPGGDKALTEFIYQHLKYPETALAASPEGVVVVEYDIDHRGLVTDTRVVRSLGHGCDEEACRVLRMLKFDVGKNRGLRVIFHKKARIQFKKPTVQPATTAPGFQVNYEITPAAPPEKPAAPAETVYSYTVTLN